MGLCERCKKAQATFHLTNIDPDNGEKVERHLCERCSMEEGLVKLPQPAAHTEILEHFIQGMKSGKLALDGLVCEQCGLSYIEFRNQGPLGCPHDYDAFREALSPLIERAHDGATHHVGKLPRTMAAVAATRVSEQDIQRLKRQMDDAVAAEDYERAANLRDRIRRLETA